MQNKVFGEGDYHLQTGSQSSSATVDTADYEPYEDPPRAEERDDAVEEVVGSVPFHIRCGVHLWGGGDIQVMC